MNSTRSPRLAADGCMRTSLGREQLLRAHQMLFSLSGQAVTDGQQYKDCHLIERSQTEERQGGRLRELNLAS